MLALARDSAVNNMHVADWPYRFASWAFDQPENVALWTNDAGELLAWAVLQTPFWAIDYVIRPDAESSELHRTILVWADARAKTIAGTRFGRPMWFINVMAHQHERIRDLEAFGFANQTDVAEDAWSKVLMYLSPLPNGEGSGVGFSHRTPLPPGFTLRPPGFTLRPLAGEREVEAYVALHRAVFESESMTTEWRRRTLSQPGYTPDIDLVLVAPDGSLSGFCVCWLGGLRGQVEPMGIRADMQGKGLGKALLSEGLRRLIAHGATELFVETDQQRNAALALYESVGFRPRHQVFVFRKDYAEP
jgi:ribosomal protein S18 acetylase RimI-like enzyme